MALVYNTREEMKTGNGVIAVQYKECLNANTGSSVTPAYAGGKFCTKQDSISHKPIAR